jgi:UDP-GlcNAc:undecaprenyl-phosphate GlcNAc-1-phosphate transferase
MDGMASLTGLCICLTAAALDMQSGGSHVGTFVLGLAGALAGFLVFNFPPAKIYLGDTGSMVIGLAVALASMRVARTDSGVTHLTPMLALMALPLADTTLAVLRRCLSGRGIWYPDRGHLHHRLLDRGLTARGVLTLVAAFSAIWGTVVVAAGRGAAESVVWMAASLLGLLAVRWRLAGHHEWSLLAGTVWNSIRPRADLPTPAELGVLAFASAWKRLQAAAEPYPLERLSLYVRSADGSVYEHDWLKDTARAGSTEPLAIEISRLSGATVCRLRVESSQGQILHEMSQLLELLERFADFWVAHPNTVPATGLRFDTSAGPVLAGRISVPKVPEQSRAA